MNPYLLLTPGPLATSETVKKAMMADWCTWDTDYNIQIVQDIRKRLVQLATNSRPEDYTCVLLQGSGTFAVESTLTSSVTENDKILILCNGAYGKRMVDITRQAKLPYACLTWMETETVCPAQVNDYLQQHPDITHVSFVHCETTTGILNPIQELCEIIKSHHKILIIDTISSFGGIPLDIADLKIDFMVGSANKCIQGVPGFGFVIANKAALSLCKGVSHSLSLDLYDQWNTMEEQTGKWRFTSPTHVVRAFKQAMDELEIEGGIQARNLRYRKNHQILMEGMRKLGYTSLLSADVQSPIITSFLYPNRLFRFETFYNQLKEKGFIIYPGKISDNETFRIGTIGHVFPEDFQRLINTIESINLYQ